MRKSENGEDIFSSGFFHHPFFDHPFFGFPKSSAREDENRHTMEE
jgi:hypothetical protein